MLSSPTIKIIDFGEAFFADSSPRTLHTPLSVRAPEVVFGDPLDRQVDLWSMLKFEPSLCIAPREGLARYWLRGEATHG